jgi:hypothetical protein
MFYIIKEAGGCVILDFGLVLMCMEVIFSYGPYRDLPLSPMANLDINANYSLFFKNKKVAILLIIKSYKGTIIFTIMQ